MNVLVPFERGIPYVRVGPAALMFPVLFNLAAFALLILARPLRTLRRFRHPPLFWQGAVAVLFLARGATSFEAAKGIATGLIYASTWVAQYALLLAVIETLGRAAFARIYVAVAAIGATLGVIEGLTGYILPPYTFARLADAIAQGYASIEGVGRVDGPVGNSILFAFMMALSVPFAFEIRLRPLRWTLVAFFVAAVALSIARIGFLMLIVLALGGLLLGGSRARAAAVGLGFVLVAALAVAVIVPDNPVVERIGARLTGQGEASENVRFRTEAIRLALDRTFFDGNLDVAVWGAGIRKGDTVGKSIAASVKTLDNVYVTVLYEGGLLLLFTFLAAHTFHLRRLWVGYGPARFYWFGLVAGLVGGIAFVSAYTIGANFPFVATLAVLSHERLVRRKLMRAAARQAPAPALASPAGTP